MTQHQIQTQETETLAEKCLRLAQTKITDPQLQMLLMMFEGNIRSVPDEQIRASIEEAISFMQDLLK